MKSILKFSLSLLFSFVLLGTVFANEAIPDKPSPPRLLNDFAGLFSVSQQQQLEQELVRFSNSTSTQIVVVIVTTLNGYDKAAFATELGEKWGVGTKGKDNGIVLLIKPKEIDGRGEIFISTGYGLEGIIPDAVANQIVDNEIIPRLKQKDYFGGVVAGIAVLEDLALKEYSAADYTKKNNSGAWINLMLPLFLILGFIFMKFLSVRSYASSNNLSFLAAMMLVQSTSRSHGGSYSSFSSGGGSFGGFGGGSFGGGGAGGSW